MGEFDLIKRFFTRDQPLPPQVPLGIGDDCAIVTPTPGMQWLISSDMLVEGRHFLSTVAPERLGHKALAVNLSDLAACGAMPRAFTLALALPRADEAWLAGFARGLFALADAHGIVLVGGDTTAGPLNICITVMGEAPPGAALLRSGARPGDALYVCGTLGDARLALEAFRGTVMLPGPEDLQLARRAMECPQPRVALGQALRGVASSAIDVSDGLLGDLGHLLARSGGLGATVQADALPRSALLARQPLALQRLCTLAGGDDYELVFTAPPAAAEAVRAAAAASATPVTRIGCIEPAAAGLRLLDAQGQVLPWSEPSFDHIQVMTSAPQSLAPRRPSWRFMLGHPARCIALGFGSGLSPKAPGTAGTLWAWAVFVLLDRWLGDVHWAALIGGGTLLGWWACTLTARHLNTPDPGSIVWDEVLAFWLVLWLAMPMGFVGQLLAFGLFRYFDAAKPGPVAWADRLFKGERGQPPGWAQGFGILLDDFVAAACTLGLIALGRLLMTMMTTTAG